MADTVRLSGDIQGVGGVYAKPRFQVSSNKSGSTPLPYSSAMNFQKSTRWAS